MFLIFLCREMLRKKKKSEATLEQTQQIVEEGRDENEGEGEEAFLDEEN